MVARRRGSRSTWDQVQRHDAPGGALEALLALAVFLKGCGAVSWNSAAVGFDDQAGIAPEEIGLKRIAAPGTSSQTFDFWLREAWT